ncbi:hypothetical protein B0H13DRAFT_2333069 [Mycena leptocephala]|nr:hypothetical protein B0H13DRAFT_2333069 [Mycena leptocephala]
MAHSGLELITNNAAPPLKFYKMPSLSKRSQRSCLQAGERWTSLDWLMAPFYRNQRRIIVTYDIGCQYHFRVAERLIEDALTTQSA